MCWFESDICGALHHAADRLDASWANATAMRATIVKQSINKSNYSIDQNGWLFRIRINSEELLETEMSNGLFHH